MTYTFLSGVWGHPHAPDAGPASDREAAAAKRSAEQLEARLDRALLTMEAMWSLLRDKLGTTDEELLGRVVDIDLSDGVLDGKVRRPALQCPQCERRIPRRFARCMYCGCEIRHDPFG